MQKGAIGIMKRIGLCLTPPCLRAGKSRRSVEGALSGERSGPELYFCSSFDGLSDAIRAKLDNKISDALTEAIRQGHIILCPEQYYELVISWSRDRSSDVIKAMLTNLGIPMLKEGLCVSNIGYQNFDLIIKLSDAKFSDEYEDQIADKLGAPIIDSRIMGSSKKWHRGRPEFAHLTLVEAKSNIAYITERAKEIQKRLNKANKELEFERSRYEEALRLTRENLPFS